MSFSCVCVLVLVWFYCGLSCVLVLSVGFEFGFSLVVVRFSCGFSLVTVLVSF